MFGQLDGLIGSSSDWTRRSLWYNCGFIFDVFSFDSVVCGFFFAFLSLLLWFVFSDFIFLFLVLVWSRLVFFSLLPSDAQIAQL